MDMNLNELTVLELRKVAKEMKVPLGAGISKQGIIDKLNLAMAEQNGSPAPAESDTEVSPAAEPAAPTAAPATEAPVGDEGTHDEPAAQPQFKQAYVAPQRFSNRPAYQAPAYNRPATPRPTPPTDTPRTTATRPVGFQSRFGPAAQTPAQPQHDAYHEEERPYQEAARPAFGPSHTANADQPRFQPRPQFDQPRQPSYDRLQYDQPRQPSYDRPQYDQPRQPSYDRPQYDQPRQPGYDRPQYDQPRQDYGQRPSYPPRSSFPQEPAPFTANPAAAEIAQAVNCPEFTGFLELLPEGYGFLRSEAMVATGRDVYVSSAQVRRFDLRSGDRITGKMRPAREGDKYPALLTVSQVNGSAPESAVRPHFDQLTPIYPTRRICLERKEGPQLSDLRLMDLITPSALDSAACSSAAPAPAKPGC